MNDSLVGGDSLPNKSFACCFGLDCMLLVWFEVTLFPSPQSITISSLMPPVFLVSLAEAWIISGETNLAVSGETGLGLLGIVFSLAEDDLGWGRLFGIGHGAHGGFHSGQALLSPDLGFQREALTFAIQVFSSDFLAGGFS